MGCLVDASMLINNLEKLRKSTLREQIYEEVVQLIARLSLETDIPERSNIETSYTRDVCLRTTWSSADRLTTGGLVGSAYAEVTFQHVFEKKSKDLGISIAGCQSCYWRQRGRA
jgi:hypothetical protein